MVIARQGARELAERDGLSGIQSALAALVDKVPGATMSGDGAAEAAGDDGAKAEEAAAR